jgi:hypothetical protein
LPAIRPPVHAGGFFISAPEAQGVVEPVAHDRLTHHVHILERNYHFGLGEQWDESRLRAYSAGT